MGIKLDSKTKTYTVQYQKRHPITRQPIPVRRTRIKTLAEAKRVERELILIVEEKIRRKIIPTWHMAVEDFLKAGLDRGWTLKTNVDYGLTLRAHTFEIWQDRLVDSITTREIRELIVRRFEKKLNQQKVLLKMIRAVFGYAIEAGLIVRNPSPVMVFKTGDKIRRVLTETQAQLLLERAKQMDSDWYPHWVMALYTGMRNGELYALTWDKVNFETRQLIVDCSWNPDDGFKSTKSGDDRVVDLAPDVLVLLKRWKLERSDSNFVLPRLSKWDVGEQARELRMFLMGIGIAPVKFHDLRATWATMMLSKGVEPIKVMSMGGWKDIKTMMIYARKAGIDIKGVASCLAGLHNPSIDAAKVLNIGSRREM